MYKINENYNINTLIGEVVFQIAFGMNFITLFFSKGFIQFAGSFAIIFKNQLREYDEVYPVKNDFGLLQLLDKKIIKVEVNNHRNILILLFENKFSLKLIGNKDYESYKIKINNEEFFI